MTSNDDQILTIKELAQVIGKPLNSVGSLRQRGHWPCWDGGPYDEHYDTGWHRYSVIDAALVSALTELVAEGFAAKVAASILANNRGTAIGAKHPQRPSDDDAWIGILRFEDGAAHVGGRLPEVLRNVAKKIKTDIEHFEGGGGSSLVLVNVSKHIRRVRRALEERDA